MTAGADKQTGPSAAAPATRKPPARRATDDMLKAIDALSAGLRPRLAEGLSIKRDNPGKTPQQWSVKDADGNTVLSFGLIDRTFFWSWDEGVSNHYSKSREMMARIITSELARFGHLA
jgi:hypothetical protein